MGDETEAMILDRLVGIERQIHGNTERLIRVEEDIKHINRARELRQKILVGVLTSGIVALAGALVAVYVKVAP